MTALGNSKHKIRMLVHLLYYYPSRTWSAVGASLLELLVEYFYQTRLSDILRRTNKVDRANSILENRPEPQMLVVNAPLELSMAQHIFSAFTWAIAGKVPGEEPGHATVDPRAFNVDEHGTWN